MTDSPFGQEPAPAPSPFTTPVVQTEPVEEVDPFKEREEALQKQLGEVQAAHLQLLQDKAKAAAEAAAKK